MANRIPGLDEWMSNEPERFGYLFSKSVRFRRSVEHILKGAIGGQSKITIGIDPEDGKPRFKVMKGAQEEYFKDIKMARAAANDSLSSVRTYTGRQVGKKELTSFGRTGPAFNPWLEAMAEDLGGEVSLKTFKPFTTKGGYREIERIIGGRGMIFPSQDVVNVIQFKPHGSQEFATFEHITDLLKKQYGIQAKDVGKVFKRMSMFTSERVLMNVTLGAENMINVAEFNPKALITSGGGLAGRLGPNYGANIKATLGTMGGDESDLLEKMFDGSLIINKNRVRLMIEETRRRADTLDEVAKNMRAQGKDATLVRQTEQQAASLRRMMAETENRMNKGLSFSYRGLGVNQGDPDKAGLFYKGEAIALDDETFRGFMARVGMKIRPDGILPELIAPAGSGKNEITMMKGSIETLEAISESRDVYSNIAEVATFSEHFEKDYVTKSIQSEVGEALESLRTGKLSKKFRAQLNDIVSMTDFGDNPSAAEFSEMLQAQKYARDILTVSNAGLSPAMFDASLRRFISSYKKHFNKLRKGPAGQYMPTGNTPDMQFRVRLGGTYMGHISNLELMREVSQDKVMSPRELLGRTLSNVQGGRIGISGMSVVEAYAAHGGPDFDDLFKASLKYDSTTRRLMALTTRDPMSAGEFMYYDVNPVNLTNIPKELRALFTKERDLMYQITRDVNQLVQTTGDTKAKKAARELNTVRAQIQRMITGMDDIEKVDLRQRLSATGARAPKGFRFTADSSTEYGRLNYIRSFSTVSLNTQADYERLAKTISFELTQAGTSYGSPFEYMGEDYNIFDPRYQTFLAKDAAQAQRVINAGTPGVSRTNVMTMGDFLRGNSGLREPQIADLERKLAAGAKVNDALTRESAYRRMQAEFGGEGVLGKYVNAEMAVDNFFKTYLTKGSLPVRGDDYKRFLAPVITRELIIDAATQNAEELVLEAAKNASEHQVRAMVRTILELRKGGDTTSGIDPYLYEHKLKGQRSVINSEIVAAEKSGLVAKGTTADIILSDKTADTAYMSQFIDIFKAESGAAFDVGAEEITQEGFRGMRDMLSDFAPTVRETKLAREFVQGFGRNIHDVGRMNIPSALANIAEGMAGIDDLDDAYFGAEEINRRSLRMLDSWGLLEKGTDGAYASTEGLNRQMLAISKYISQNTEALRDQFGAAYEPVFTHSAAGGGGIADLMMEAINSHRGQGMLAEYDSIAQRIRASSSKVEQRALQFRGRRVLRDLGAVHPGMAEAVRGQVRAIGEGVVPVAGRGPIFTRESIGLGPRDLNLPEGYLTASRQEAADVASKAISGSSGPIMKRFNMEAFNQLSGRPGVRGGLMALAGLGIMGMIYGATHRGMTPEKMQGPPLLPGGSAYEDYEDTQDMQSMYPSPEALSFSRGTTYRINASGSFDPQALQSELSSISAGPMNSTIYKSRATTRSGNRTSNSILGELMNGS